ncbi:LacI family transcriptional regulator [candidate division KSB1 bacterium]|nr:LacI family transcriptional regulator [candidate division KSB1 bacterium]
MKITIADVAKIANVSQATVSAVLNHKSTVAVTTREHVLETIQKLKYRPSVIARSLSIRTTRSIGLVIKEIDNPYFAKVMKGVFDACCTAGYTVLLGSSELVPSQEIRSIETLTDQRVDGLIISPLQGRDIDFSYLANFLREKYPLVMLGRVENYATNSVDIDNVQAAYQAVTYLIESGHQAIAHFAGPAYSAHTQDRLEGYRQALIDHNLPIYKNFIQVAGSSRDMGYQVGKNFFGTPGTLPTAVICYNDLVAMGLIDALQDLGVAVPAQVSVIGFDDIEFCRSIKVPLTTVQVPAYEIGKNAAELLIQQIANPQVVFNKKIVLEAKLIKRNSCAPKLN